MSIPGGEPDPVQLVSTPIKAKLAQRRPFREGRKTSTYKEDSDSEEDNFHDADSSLNQTVEDNSIEAQKKDIINKELTSRLARDLASCKLDGSTIVYVDSDEAQEEEVVSGIVVGAASESNLKNPNMPDPVPPIVNFEDENAVDDAQALQNACRNLERFNWDPNNLKFTFQKLEIKMSAVGVKKQYTKFQVLSTVIPKEVEDEVQSLLTCQEAEFPNQDAYKVLKKEVLRIFGPRPEEAIERALGRVLTGKPSQLARALVNDLSKCKMQCQCCPDWILALWKRQLPGNVRAGIAHCTFNKDTFDSVVQLADDIYSSSRPTPSVAAVRQSTAALNETQPGLEYPVPEVNAIRGGGRGRGRGRGRGGRGRGGGQNQSGGNQGQSGGADKPHKGTKHPDLPDGEWKGCGMHFRWGRGAFFCSAPATCPWKDVYTTKK